MVVETFRVPEARGSRGGRGHVPKKIFKFEGLKTQADSCVTKVPKIDRYQLVLLNLNKIISCNIFS